MNEISFVRDFSQTACYAVLKFSFRKWKTPPSRSCLGHNTGDIMILLFLNDEWVL